MHKKTLVILFILAAACGILAIIAEAPMILWTAQCSPDAGTCSSLPPSAIIGLILAGLFMLASATLGMTCWIAMLIKQAKRQQWSWFVCTILFGWIPMLIYLIVVPEMELPTIAMFQYQAYAPGIPQYQQPYAPGAQPYQPYPYPPQSRGEMQPPPSQG